MNRQFNVTIDPRKELYCFSFGYGDCYKLATGRCTFELTENEYQQEKAKCDSNYYNEARVGYCRELFEMMKDGGEYSATTPTGIDAHRNACGHITLSQGQHRSCIAKKNQLQKLHIDVLSDNGDCLCSSCYLEKEEVQERKRFWHIFKRSKKNKAVSIYIIDDKL
ncbi:hypothetical protein ACIQYL_25490 [Lysinibacillus xylanilyticus]|uniref:hypothetical protein n=1 Tax=Lysinibacillus xylanilyticus TaxID=582475 RepID=UPI00381D65E4